MRKVDLLFLITFLLDIKEKKIYISIFSKYKESNKKKRGTEWIAKWPRTAVKHASLHCGGEIKKKKKKKEYSSCLSQLHTSFSERVIYYEQPHQMAPHVIHSYCEGRNNWNAKQPYLLGTCVDKMSAARAMEKYCG